MEPSHAALLAAKIPKALQLVSDLAVLGRGVRRRIGTLVPTLVLSGLGRGLEPTLRDGPVHVLGYLDIDQGQHEWEHVEDRAARDRGAVCEHRPCGDGRPVRAVLVAAGFLVLTALSGWIASFLRITDPMLVVVVAVSFVAYPLNSVNLGTLRASSPSSLWGRAGWESRW